MKLHETIIPGYLAYVLDNSSHQKLLMAFPPKFPNVYAHHITIEYGILRPAEELLGGNKEIIIVGYACDESLEAVVVSIDGSINRPDGQIFHITLSLDKSKGRKPADSKLLVKTTGFNHIQRPFGLNSTLRFLR